MSKATIRDLLDLIDKGWLPYDGPVDDGVYDRLRCRDPKRAAWFQHEGTSWLCLGCARRCATADAEGFQLLLATRAPVQMVFAELPMVSASEILRCKVLLRPDEAMFCLGGISRRKFDYLCDSGVLVRHPDKPVRVTAESVQREMQRVD